VVQKLIEYDADIDARDEDGWTPLYWASEVVISKMVLSFDYCWSVVQM
jgi:ankyrin repeat protein